MNEEIKAMVEKGKKAQELYSISFDQEGVDAVVKAATKVVYDNAEELARMAIEETKKGVYEHKVAKNRNKSKGVFMNLHKKKTMGIIDIDEETGLICVAKPVGIVCSITPVTNPIVTPMANIAFALKTKNAVIVAPHPGAKKCSAYTVALIKKAIAPFNVPEDLIQVIEEPSIEKTQELMSAVDVVIATGGMAMVKSAYSSGKPSFGVGAGNVQVLLDRHIDYEQAAERIITGRAFDNGLICSGEQCFIYPEENKEVVFNAFKNHGAYFVPAEYHDAMVNALFENGSIARDIVGQNVDVIAKKAGFEVPAGTRILVVPAMGIGREDMICKEKMCPVMTCIPYTTFEDAVRIAKTNLAMEGSGHTIAVHSNNQANIIKAGTEINVSRIIVNAPSSTTAGGTIQNGLSVTTTLGCGTWGNNSISENFTYKHLLNISRIARTSPYITVPTDEEIWQLK